MSGDEPPATAHGRGFAASLARVDAICPFELRLGVPAAVDWVRADALCDPSDPALARLIERACREWPTDERIAASLLLYVYAQRLTVAAVAAYALERRVPDVAAAVNDRENSPVAIVRFPHSRRGG